MDLETLKNIRDAYVDIVEKKKLDPVDKKAVKKDFDDRDDKDIDNDGDVDSSDEYLHKRRKAVSKNIDESVEEEREEAVRSKNVGMRRALEQVWLEATERKKHVKGATDPEGLLDKESPKSKEFIDKHETEEDDTRVKSLDDVSKAGRATKQAPARNADQLDVGDKTPVK